MTTNQQKQPIGERGWVPLSPGQIRQRAFRQESLGRRGYRRDDVDPFLTRVADEIDRWSGAYTQAAGEVQRLRNYFRDQGIDPDTVRARELSVEAVSVLAKAQAHADQLIANAQAQARAMQYDARDQAESVIGRARSEADRAAHAYRAQAGHAYTADREQAERLAALGRSILAALHGATTQMDGASAQMRAISQAFATELTKLATQPAVAAPTGRAAAPAAPGRTP